MKNKYLLILILIVWTTSYGQDPIELFGPSIFTESVGSIVGYDVCSLSPEKVVTAYDEGGSWDGKLKVGIIQNDNSIEYGDAFTFTEVSLNRLEITAVSDNKFFITYKDNTGLYIRVGKVINDNEIVLSDIYTLDSIQSYSFSLTAISDNTAIIAYHEYESGKGVCKVLRTNENLEITVGTTNFFTIGSLYNSATISIDALSNSSFVIAHGYFSGYAIVGSIDQNDEISFGPSNLYNIEDSFYNTVVGLQESKFAIVFQNESNIKNGAIVIGTIDANNQITYSNKYLFNSSQILQSSALKLTANEIVICYTKSDPVDGLAGHLIRAQIFTDNVTFSESMLLHDIAPVEFRTRLAELIDGKFIIQFVDKTAYNGYLSIGEADQLLEINSLENELNYSIYVNPDNSQLVIETSQMDSSFDFELFDINGRLMHKKGDNTDAIFSMDLSQFQSGVYLVRLVDGKHTITKRILLN